MTNAKQNSFQWDKAKQLSPGKFFIAIFLPSAIAFSGFRFLLPYMVDRGVSVLAGYSIVASSMLFGFLLFALFLIRRESIDLKVRLQDRLCLRKISKKQIILSILIIIATMALTFSARPVSLWIVDKLGVNVPSFYPFFLDPRINPATADPMVLTSGIDVSGRWGLFLLLPLTLTLNVLTEEVYFRAWMLPKLARLGNGSWILNGLFFALYHTFQLWLFPELLIASLGFAFLNYKMKSIVPSLIAHLLLNALNIVSLAPLFMGQ